MSIPRSEFYNGEWYDRLTIKFAAGARAAQVRGWVHDALIRAHGFSTARRLTKRVAVSGGRFQVAIARRAMKSLLRRLRFLVDAGLIRVFVAGRRVFPAT